MKKLLLVFFAVVMANLALAQWTLLPSPSPTFFRKIKVLPTGNALLIGYLANDTIAHLFRMNPNGTDWDTLRTGNLFDFSFPHADTGFVNETIAQQGYLFRTIDAGQSWQQRGTTIGFSHFDFTNSKVGIGANSGFSTIRTNDGGISWARLAQHNSGALEQVLFASPDTAFVVGWYPGSITRYTASGAVRDMQTQVGNGFVAASFPGTQVGYAVNWGNSVYKTVDGGNSWTEFPLGFSVPGYYSLKGVYARDAQTCIVVGDSGRIFSTINSGVSWQVEPSGTTNNLKSVHGRGNVVYAAGDSGTVLRRVLPTSVSGSKYELASVSPNPVKQGQAIKVTLPKRGTAVSITFIDGNGRKLRCIKNVPGGKMDIATNALAAGTYFLIIGNDANVQTVKVLIE